MMTKQQRRFAVIALAAAAALGLTGYAPTAKNGKKVIWDYLGQTGTPTYISEASNTLTYNISTGEPKQGVGDYTTNLASLPIPDLPSTLLSKVAVMLPEGLNIAGNTRVKLSSDDQTNLVLKAGNETDVYVSFLAEGAGYRNSVGYFTYDPEVFAANAEKVKNGTMTREQLLATITTEKIFFPNTTQDGTNPPFKVATAKAASTVKFHVSAPQDKSIGVGFFVVADGWAGSRDLRLAGGVNSNTSSQTTPGVDDNNYFNNNGRKIFYSLKALNPEVDDDRNLNQHTILLNESEVLGRDLKTTYQRLILGFEDMLRTLGDNDFNDVLLAVHVTPSGPVNITNLTSITSIPGTGDRDQDGVNDLNDAYPDDPTAASYLDYPSSNGWGTLAYEDLWPTKGDYDLNDLVVRYHMRQVKHAQGKTSRVEMNFRLDASGAGSSNGFALALPGIAPGEVYVDPANTKTDDLKTYLAQIDATGKVLKKVAVTPLAADTKQAVFEVFKNAYDYLKPQSGGNCNKGGFANTSAGCPIGDFTEFKLVVKMNTTNNVPSYKNSFPGMPFDPFLFKSSTPGIEVHLPGKKPSARADTSKFKTGADASKDWNSATGTYTYMTANGLPWALNIPALWDYPAELVRVDAAYDNFVNWAKSGGTAYKDWYVTPSDKTAATYGKTDKASLQAAKTFRNGR